jgi:interferon gamma-inducible protein 30
MAARLAVPAFLLLLLASPLAAAAGGEATGKVAVALYYETLCPYSARFVVDHLAKIFEDGLLDAVDLTLVPYGNARVHAGGEITCQVSGWLRASPCGLRTGSLSIVQY